MTDLRNVGDIDKLVEDLDHQLFMTDDEYYDDEGMSFDEQIAELEDWAEEFEEDCREIEEEFDDNHHAPRKMRRMNMRNARAQSASSPRKKYDNKDLDSV